MKKAVVWGIVIVTLLIGFNIYYYTDTYRWQLNYQSRMMEKQLSLCVGHISDFFAKTQINVQLLLTPTDLQSLFAEKWRVSHPQSRLEMLYDRYGDNLKSLTVSDVRGSYYRISKGFDHSFITEYGMEEPQVYYRSTILFSVQDHQIFYLQPLMDRHEIYGFVKFGIDMKGYFDTVLQHFYFSALNFQYVLMPNTDLVYYKGGKGLFQSGLSPDLLANIDDSHALVHQVSVDGKQVSVLSVIKRMVLNGSTYYLVFSMPRKELTATIVRNSFIVGFVTLGVLVLFAAAFIYYIRHRNVQEHRIRQSQETLRKVLYYLPVGVVLSDDQNIVRQVNKAALQLFECVAEEELVGCVNVDDLWFDAKTIINKSRISASTVRYRLQNSAGDIFVVVNERIPFFFENVCHHIDVFFEVSNLENKCQEEGSRDADAKSNFIANISHELRTPLNGIIGMAEILRKMSLGSDEQNILSTIRSSANTLLVLINDILDFSKIDAGKFHVESIPFNLKSEIEEIIESFQLLAQQKRIKLWWHSSVPIPNDFIGDPIRFRQILNNLISNALKFTVEGEVVLHVTKGHLFNGNEGLQFEVHDSGIGIREEVIKHIFDPFWQADGSTTRRYGGTGLGTTIARQLVELMGGQIRVQSPSCIRTNAEYPGSSFIFTLPLLTRTLDKTIDFSGVKVVSDIRVAIVTDDAGQVHPLIRNLQLFKVQWSVLGASDQTMEQLSMPNGYHVVIIDHRPNFDGLMFLQRMHNQGIDLRYLIMVQSSDLPSQNTNLVKRLGADVYLRKPVRVNLLREFFIRHFHLAIPFSDPLITKKLNILLAQNGYAGSPEAFNLFNRVHHHVDVASSGVEVLNNFKERQYDVVFLDLSVSVIDGLATSRELKRSGYDVPIIAIGGELEEVRQRALSCGVCDFIDGQASHDDVDRLLVKWCPPILN